MVSNKIDSRTKETATDNIDNKESSKSNYTMGVTCLLGSVVCFSLMNLFVRLAGDLPSIQKSFFRNVIALIVALIALSKSKGDFRCKKGNFKDLFLRALAGTIGVFCNFYAMDNLNISDASILNKLSPFFAIIFSFFILKEKANKFEWTAVIIAFVGALFVIKPSFNVEVIPAFIGFLGGCAAGMAYTYVRKLGLKGERSMIIVLYFSVFSTLCTLPYMIFDYCPMSLKQLIILILCGLSAAGGQVLITKAYSFAPAKEISVFDFSIVITTAILGYLFLNQSPDILSIVGYAIIIGVAVVKWRYGLKMSKRKG
ncbi:MAG: DMT family transporter [Lachnospiraceae bacterium]|nr:DMT family transporter [Lachnospiraceae bacterium]